MQRFAGIVIGQVAGEVECGVRCAGVFRYSESTRMEKIGRYTILGELGRGGFGIVFKAQDPRINRIVAIKTIPTQELRSFAGGQQLY